jgi:hypothetical protein
MEQITSLYHNLCKSLSFQQEMLQALLQQGMLQVPLQQGMLQVLLQSLQQVLRKDE